MSSSSGADMRSRLRRWFGRRSLGILAVLAGCAGLPAPTRAPGPARGPDFAIYARSGRSIAGIEALADSLARYDVVLWGEDHEDSIGHRREAELLDALARRGRPLVLGMEMFERDVQPALDAHLAGILSDTAFRSRSRPWSNYAADYRPLLERAREHGWPVIASDVPRALAGMVSTSGLGALSVLESTDRVYVAAEIDCPQDEYYRRFLDAMQEEAHPTAGPGADPRMQATLLRYYQAQCMKDETMAESIAAALRPGSLLVHFNGAFHSDRRLGIVPRLLRRAPGVRVAVISAVPTGDTRRLAPADRVGDYVVLTRAP
jgi:uncharacterized iron-regulated protein